MDYQFFLVTRMHEKHTHDADNDTAIAVGFQHGARVVTAAALIRFSIFAAFSFADNPILKSIGFALSAGILADAFLVRMTLVPALMSLVGDGIWWLPERLERLLPNLDIEAATLSRDSVRTPERSDALVRTTLPHALPLPSTLVAVRGRWMTRVCHDRRVPARNSLVRPGRAGAIRRWLPTPGAASRSRRTRRLLARNTWTGSTTADSTERSDSSHPSSSRNSTTATTPWRPPSPRQFRASTEPGTRQRGVSPRSPGGLALVLRRPVRGPLLLPRATSWRDPGQPP
jgi:hypothetical protein